MVMTNIFSEWEGKMFVNYDYIDILNGRAWEYLYAGKTTTHQLLTGFTYYSTPPITKGNTSSTSYSLLDTSNFDLEINNPHIMNGKLILTVSFGGEKSGTATGYIKLNIEVFHYDGSTETSLGSTDLTYSGLNAFNTRKSCSLDISSQRFKKGEYLRIKIKLYGRVSTCETCHFYYCHDPSNSDIVDNNIADITFPTRLDVKIPLKIIL